MKWYSYIIEDVDVPSGVHVSPSKHKDIMNLVNRIKRGEKKEL